MIEDDYQDNVGHAPVERYPEDHPDRWQWDYVGSKDEREGLLDRLAGNDPVPVDDEEPPSQEESLF